MSYRPTISVYINGHIVDLGYYRNWNDTDLFFEAMATAALFSDCESKYEYNQKKYGTQKVYHDLSPEYWENTEENLKELESYSECPILVDLTAKNIYISEGAKNQEELMSMRNALEDHKNYGIRKEWRIIGWEEEEEYCCDDMVEYIVCGEGMSPVFEEYEEEIPAVKNVSVRNVHRMMHYCRIPFDHVDMNEVLRLFQEEKELQRHLSISNIKLLEENRPAA